MKTPILSVIVANYNYGKYLEDAILSVIKQDGFEKAELIVVDGGSTDESVQVIRKYEANISWWCSEKDSGQSEAFNKGFSHAKGRFLTWLNADDVFLPCALKRLFEAIECHSDRDWFVGGCCYVTKDLQIFRCIPTRPLSRIRASMSEIQVYGPSSFFSRRLFDRVGGQVCESFHYLMDIELWNRFYRVGHVKYCRLPGYFWGFRFQPYSKTTGYQCAPGDKKGEGSQLPLAVLRMREERSLIKKKYSDRADSVMLLYISTSILSRVLGWIDTVRFRGRTVHIDK